jgi:hypothetical protein
MPLNAIELDAACATSKCASIEQRHNIDRTSSLHRHRDVTLTAHWRGDSQINQSKQIRSLARTVQDASVERISAVRLFLPISPTRKREIGRYDRYKRQRNLALQKRLWNSDDYRIT